MPDRRPPLIALLPILALLPVLAPLIAPSSVAARPVVGMIFPAGSLSLAQSPAQCGAVQTLITPINDVAEAMPGWILLDPRVLSMPAAIQHFWYAHECAHHVLGADEQRADCWAIRTGRDKGWFMAADFDWMDRHMRHYPGDATHLPGPQRVAAIKACFRDPTPAEPIPS